MTTKKMELLKFYTDQMKVLKNTIDRIIEVDELMKDVRFIDHSGYSSYKNLEKAKSRFKAEIDRKIEHSFFIDALNTNCQKGGFDLDKITDYNLVEYLDKHHSSIEKETAREIEIIKNGRTVNKSNTIFKYTCKYLKIGYRGLDYNSIYNLMKVLYHGHGIETKHGYIAGLEFTDGWNDFDGFSVKIYKNQNFDIKIKK